VWYRLGRAYMAQGASALPDALDALTKAAGLAPRDTGARLQGAVGGGVSFDGLAGGFMAATEICWCPACNPNPGD